MDPEEKKDEVLDDASETPETPATPIVPDEPIA